MAYINSQVQYEISKTSYEIELTAVADASMWAQSKELSTHLAELSIEDRALALKSNPNLLLETATEFECVQGSIMAIYFLQSKYPESFEYLFLLGGNRTKEKPFKLDFSNHYYAVGKGKSGTWFAISPANHIANQTVDSPFSKVEEAQSLSELLDNIAVADGGLWPSIDFIEQIQHSKYQAPKVNFPIKDREGEPTYFKFIKAMSIYVDSEGKEIEPYQPLSLLLSKNLNILRN